MLGAKPMLQLMVPAVSVDAMVSRQILSVIGILQAQAGSGGLGDFVVVHTGNNGPVSQSEFDSLMQVVANVAHVILINNKEPRSWEQENDDLFAYGTTQYANAELIDWRAESAAHGEYFGDDSIHLTTTGAIAYAGLVAGRLSPYGVSIGGD